MSGTVTTSELTDRLVQQSGMKKKLAAEILHAIPEIIEEGLMRDGEVRVKGLGTFRMKWTQSRPGRNPKTGENVPIPPHYRITFLPEQSLKDFINRDNRLLSYTVVPEESSADSLQSSADSLQSSVVSSQSSVVSLEKSELDGQQEEQEIDYEYEPEEPVRKRRVHWIIPAAIVLIAALSVVFYFRNFYHEKKTEDRRQKSEVRSQKSEVSSQPADTGYGLQVAGVQNDTAEQAASHEPQAQLKTQQLNLKTQNSKLKTISEGKHLFQIAREEYGNPFLWVLIYKANQDIIKDPDQAIIGKTVNIPALEGTPNQLSHNDSLEVAEGFRLVWEFYKANGDQRAEEFHKVYQKYLDR